MFDDGRDMPMEETKTINILGGNEDRSSDSNITQVFQPKSNFLVGIFHDEKAEGYQVVSGQSWGHCKIGETKF